jgi:hypothetical protein
LWNGVTTLRSIGIHNELSLTKVVFGSILYISWSLKRPLLRENTWANSISNELQTYWFQKWTMRNMIKKHKCNLSSKTGSQLNWNTIHFDSVSYRPLTLIWLSCWHHATMLVSYYAIKIYNWKYK